MKLMMSLVLKRQCIVAKNCTQVLQQMEHKPNVRLESLVSALIVDVPGRIPKASFSLLLV